ncbi:probable receptor-like protein kinase At2g39360 isoform X2 [Punica granatum]|uniref:Probable receptor-like protein kinase At2g39360 isoform X2 n=1 Tax=Punica granatum TaxID=22663 RepID=A0A6P8BTK7_PUNGR|nr:probable receptor-like protein kinase At2g39360 isoform X2 [Punica granatum]
MKVLFILSLWIHLALGSVPEDNYLIDCGSRTNNTAGSRNFSADNPHSYILSTSQTVLADTNSTSPLSSSYDPSLFLTARIFNSFSQYKFPIREKGWHFVRLYFFPFVFENYNLSRAEFSVSVQNVTLLRNFRIESGVTVKEYSFNVSSNQIVLTFSPNSGSFAFINALEITSIPSEVIPAGANSIDTPARVYLDFHNRALETVARVNMGNMTVLPQNDSLWRLWVSDDASRKQDKVKFVNEPEAVSYKPGGPTENIAPVSVYGTATTADPEPELSYNANLTWLFQGLNLGSLTTLGAPYFFDVVASPTDQGDMAVRLAPSDAGQYPTVILNGLEIMKLSNSKESLDASDAEFRSSGKRSRKKTVIIIGLASGIFLVAAVLVALALLLICGKRRKLTVVRHSNEEDQFRPNRAEEKDHEAGFAMISSSKIGYRFPFGVIEEATDKFSESLVIGVGGFGKVYKGVLRDGTTLAVKRGSGKSNQGLQEFRTEIEMLSQFRHRHLVSLIGYCDELDEMIIIYEFMENGTVKNHLYGSDFPVLSYRQRLEICIGSAKGLHYLHTGTAKAIIHRDVKSANILLDENFMAKVADFGLSKTGPDLNETHVSTAIKGSFGYLDPEYLIRQQLTEKSDVYSFGVVMLEVLSGRPVIDPSRPREEVNLVEWAKKWQMKGKLHEIVDPRIAGQMKDESLIKFVEIAAKCLAGSGADRPSMGDVLWNLEFALQLEGKDVKPSQSEGFLSGINRSEISVSTPEFSMRSMGDLAGVSMSKVFARMVKEEMR